MSVIEEFVSLCRAEAELASRLVVLLEQEQQVLIQRQENRLAALADDKSAVLDLLASQSALRGRLLAEQGVQDKDTLYIWLADKAEACSAWVELEDAIGRAQSINQLNESFVSERLNEVEGALNVLRNAAADTLGYGKDGNRPDVVTGRRLLGSA
ncbi:flagella synthesis protein FlgN [Chromobacterium paludis]|uniref:Flagellar protein FlgN n=1 Tax=Chromobacterium paludis TaxID=2605945 RepID=A0A5C1DCR8_9NEIS|nr:flagellar protein FlgN [Chromobacterium paludis]QEL54203.1 flagellar protein FlgN [Chromobacterium paludis]